MKFLRNLLAIFAFVAMLWTPVASADEINDVQKDYWASAEINDVVAKDIMDLDDDNNFFPEDSVSRGDFVKMLVSVLGHKDLTVKVQNPYTDINSDTDDFDAIMKSEEIGLIYGYPDGTFKPENKMTKAEVTSVMSHITKNMYAEESLLDNFSDTNLIPAWAKTAYAKTVKYNLYVNHPEATAFEPNREITRAEVAVLLSRLSKELGLVKKEYVSQEVTNAVEHLNVHPDAESNIVTITNMKKIIAQGNILKVDFANVFKAKEANVGDEVAFVVKNDVVTNEGTTVIPAGTKLYATVEDLIKPRWFNKTGEVKVKFTRMELSDGRTAEIDGEVYNNRNGYLRENPWKKIGAWTLGGAVVGTGAGMAIGIPSDETGAGFAVGTPAGAGTGAILGAVTKGANYKAKEGETVFIKVLNNVGIVESL